MSHRALPVLLLVGVVCVGVGCAQLDGRNRNRQGNRLFRDGNYADAIAQFDKALTEVDNPVIHYNIGLAYSKVFKAGYDKPILLAKQSEDACKMIPQVKPVEARVCIKEGDRHYLDCDEKGQCPLSYTCVKDTFCSLTAKQIADTAAEHLQKWIKVQPPDDELKAKVKEVQKEVEELVKDEARENATKSDIASDEDKEKDLGKEIDDLQVKGKTRALLTQMWIDSDQYDKAIAYWTDMLQHKPNDPDIMGSLAGINLKAGNWRKSIEWYLKVADASSDVSAKVAAYQFIGNVAWSKLNSKTLTGADTVELADRGIGALQKASVLQPDNPRPVGLQASIYNFRALAQGASWAASLDRASVADLQHATRVLNDKAKKAAAGGPTTPTPTPPAPAGGGPAKTGG
ncbi:MAG: tetratricopeptide repeat protein [Acidobacteriota bacterium]